MATDFIDIDEVLTDLWEEVYKAVVQIVDSNHSRNAVVPLSDAGLLESVLVTADGIIVLTAKNGTSDIAERFSDEYLYEAYTTLRSHIR